MNRKQQREAENRDRALLMRLSRSLAADNLALRKAHPWTHRQRDDLGLYYLVDLRTNAVVKHHVDLAQLARERAL